MLVAPSILSADFGNLSKEIRNICQANCDLIHIDVMDGHFVPNLTIGPLVVESIAKEATKGLDIHLMVKNSNFFIDLFAHLKPEYMTFHIEQENHPHRLINKIRSLGIKPGVVLNPHTSPKTLEYLLKELDIVLLMSVNPGFGGQNFITSVIEKVKYLKKMIKEQKSNSLIEVDGGVSDKNIRILKSAGVDIVVAGSYIFNNNYKKAIQSLHI